ncbi:T9SS type A sorting domain-containing protein [bacterium]|nr:T9SS type A sorting domain-containing protein [bacterium]
MRKYIILVSITILSLSSAFAELRLADINSSGFSAIYNSPEYSIEEIAPCHSSFKLAGAGMISHPGNPELPVFTEYILLAPNCRPTIEWEITSSETLFADPPAPSQYPVHENGEAGGPPVPESRIYQLSSVWPESFINLESVGSARGIPFGTLTLLPVSYDFSINAYIIVLRARLFVDLGGCLQALEDRLASKPYLAMLTEIALNGNAMPSPLSADPGEYLIICPDTCWDAVADLVQHKESRGHRVEAIRLSEIGSPITADAIYSYIQSEYETHNPAPTFVILVGDKEMNDGTEVPDFGYSFYNSDHGYSLLDGEDFFSDVFLGRMPVDNLLEFRVLIEKIKRFESSPTASGSDWMQRGMVVSTYDHAVTPVWNVLWVRQLLLDHGFSVVDSFFENGSYVPPASEISAKINAGVSYVDYRGWAGSDGWWEPAYYRSDIVALTNTAYPVITSIVCGTGDFGSTWTDPCFGEAWIRAGSVSNPRGAVAFFGTSDHDSHTRYNNPMNSGFYKGLFDHNLPHLGQCVWLAEAECYRLHPFEHDEVEQYFMTYGPLGDPGLMMYHGWTPELEISHSDIVLGADVDISITSDGTALPEALVCLYRIASSEKTFAYTDFTGRVRLVVPGAGAGTIRLTVVSPFHVSYSEDFSVIGTPNLSVASFEFDDASGDSDGLIDPGESGMLSVEIRNNGPLARHIETYLWCDHEGIEVTSNFDSLERLWGGEERTVTFQIIADGLASGGGPARMNLLCDTREGGAMLQFNMPIETSAFLLDSIIIDDLGDSDGILDPGETAQARLVIRHSGSLDPSPILFKVFSYSGWVDVAGDSVALNSLSGGIGETVEFTLSASPNAFKGTVINLSVLRVTERGLAPFGEIQLALGEAETSDPTGPDGWGYFAYDDTDISSGHAPTSSFEDISSTGTFRSIDDDEIFTLDLPFDFIFYGELFDTLTICSNGWAAPGVQPYFMLDFYNTPIPAPNGPWGTLAPFWDDLEPIVGPGGIYYEYLASEGKYIVQWEQMQHARIDGMNNTFQIIIFDPEVNPSRSGDSPIEFRYSGSIEDVDSNEEYSTVGIESPSHVFGLEYQFGLRSDAGAAFLTDGRIIRFTTDCGAALIFGYVMLELGHPEGAEITTSGGHRTTPNSDCYYRYTEIEPGENIFTCSAPGHFAQAETVTAISDESIELDFMLSAVPIPEFISISKEDGSGNITLNWSSVSPSPTSYKLLKFLSPGSTPEAIESPDTVFIDTDVVEGRKYWYRIVSMYENGESFASAPDSGWLVLLTGIDEISTPDFIGLSITPNPFNSSLCIRSEAPGNKELVIFDLLGRRVKSMNMSADTRQVFWTGDDENSMNLPSGVYFIELKNENHHFKTKAVLIK